MIAYSPNFYKKRFFVTLIKFKCSTNSVDILYIFNRNHLNPILKIDNELLLVHCRTPPVASEQKLVSSKTTSSSLVKLKSKLTTAF